MPVAVHELDAADPAARRAAADFLARLRGRMALMLAQAAAPDPRATALFGAPLSPEAAVTRILADVQHERDAAVCRYTARLDGATLTAPIAPLDPARLAAAWAAQPAPLREALRAAHAHILDFQRRVAATAGALPAGAASAADADARAAVGFRRVPISRVGVYVPAGGAPLVSSVLMNVLPAQAAGVPDIAVVSPPRPDSESAAGAAAPDPAIMAALHLCGVREVYPVGGAQAIGLLAYGGERVRPVDMIVGPGNLYVALAKRAVYGTVALDMFAGPSEVVIVADEEADAECCAADLLAQAEHDALAAAVLITPSAELAARVRAALARRLAALPRADIARAALGRFGGVLIVRDLDAALAAADVIAPEHLELLIAEPERALDRVPHAGAVFLGPWSPEPIGDYCAGPSHTLPTGGSARFFSGLSALSFLRTQSLIAYRRADFQRAADAVRTLARAERLEGHAQSIEARQASGFGLRASDGEGDALGGRRGSPSPGAKRRAGAVCSPAPGAKQRAATPDGSPGGSPSHPTLKPEAWSLKPEAWSLKPEVAPPARDPRALVRPHLPGVAAYTPGFQPADLSVVKLNTNENPYPPSPLLAEALAAFDPEWLRRYPPPGAEALRAAFARTVGAEPAEVLAGNGSDELLALLMRACVAPGETVAYPVPTYSLYRTLAAVHDARAFELPWGDGGALPADFAARAASARLVFLCNPNAPTGTLVPPEEVAALAEALPGLLVVDEAYAEFARADCLGLRRTHANVVVLRTLSKSWSLAGLRVGFALGRPELLAELDKVRDSYNMDRLAQELARAALADESYPRAHVARVKEARAALAAALRARGFDAPDSEANFLWVRPPAGSEAGELARGLAARGVFVRYFADCPDRLRITVGRPEQHARLDAALNELLA